MNYGKRLQWQIKRLIKTKQLSRIRRKEIC